MSETTYSEGKTPEQIAEEHWEYTEGIINILVREIGLVEVAVLRELAEYLYVKAMIHGLKHRLEDAEK